MASPDDKHQIYDYISAGLELAVSLSLPILAGFWLDSRYETTPWLLLAGILLGAGLFIGVIWRLARRLNSR